MFTSYYESVLAHADAEGLLRVEDANQLMQEHGTSLYELEQDGYKGHHCDAEALLEWLGY